MGEPTPEQIAAMEARGWAWNGRRFRAESAPAGTSGHYVIGATVNHWGDAWRAVYGWTGVGFDKLTPHDTPLLAADEAEAWLRGVLAGFKFPWLKMEVPNG